MNVGKQIQYWKQAALSDLDTAEVLISNKKLREGLFFCHLSMEKALKAHYVKTNRAAAPRTHNLFFFISKCGIDADQLSEDLLGKLMKYQLEGRYPETISLVIPQTEADVLFRQTQDRLRWLIEQL
jgi:HEPN domain-containing protein